MKRSLKRKFNKLLKRNKTGFRTLETLLALCLVLYSVYVWNMNRPVDPTVYRPLLELIGKAESNGNYNAYFGNSANTQIDFTSMSVAEVLEWQQTYIDQGSPSSAVGRYQILNTTLSGLVQKLDVDTSQKFDESMQDRMAVALLEKRGADEYANQKMSKEDFAANLAKEWAALPKVKGENPHQSYYAEDGLNKSRVKVDEILTVIDKVKQ